MKKTKITITVEGELSEREKSLLRYLLCDAFGEFAAHRSPAQAYVDRRYPNEPGYAWLDRVEKVRDVLGRVALAEKLRNGATSFDYETDINTEGKDDDTGE